ncbi:MAG: hypothetical protein AB8I08_31655 [Sandaracinaceae bacterium]
MTPLLQRQRGYVLKSNGEKFSWLEIMQQASSGQLEAMMRAGTAPPYENLAGWEFAGGNTPNIYRVVGIRKFVKGFYDGGDARERRGPKPFIQGYNIDVPDNDDQAPHQLADEPKRWGFYRTHAVVEGSADSLYPNALLLDYSLGGNGPLGPPLRDYLVQIYPENPDLLLGKAYLNLLGVRVPSNFFVLERLHQHDFTG